MFIKIIEFIKEFFRLRNDVYGLEKAIMSSNPITHADIEAVEKEFWDKRHRISVFDTFY